MLAAVILTLSIVATFSEHSHEHFEHRYVTFNVVEAASNELNAQPPAPMRVMLDINVREGKLRVGRKVISDSDDESVVKTRGFVLKDNNNYFDSFKKVPVTVNIQRSLEVYDNNAGMRLLLVSHIESVDNNPVEDLTALVLAIELDSKGNEITRSTADSSVMPAVLVGGVPQILPAPDIAVEYGNDAIDVAPVVPSIEVPEDDEVPNKADFPPVKPRRKEHHGLKTKISHRAHKLWRFLKQTAEAEGVSIEQFLQEQGLQGDSSMPIFWYFIFAFLATLSVIFIVHMAFVIRNKCSSNSEVCHVYSQLPTYDHCFDMKPSSELKK
jgi:hypothetical protein